MFGFIAGKGMRILQDTSAENLLVACPSWCDCWCQGAVTGQTGCWSVSEFHLVSFVRLLEKVGGSRCGKSLPLATEASLSTCRLAVLEEVELDGVSQGNLFKGLLVVFLAFSM